MAARHWSPSPGQWACAGVVCRGVLQGIVKMPRLPTANHFAQIFGELHHLRNITPPHLQSVFAAVEGLCLDAAHHKYLLMQEVCGYVRSAVRRGALNA